MNFLPGWHPGFFAASADVAASISFVDSSVSTGNTITTPAGIQAGDLIIIGHCASDEDGTAPANVTPSGFTQMGTVTDSSGGVSIRQSVHYKLAAGTESSTAFNVIDGNNSYVTPNQRSVCMVFRHSTVPSSWTPSDVAGVADIDAAVGDQVINASGEMNPLVAIAIGQFNPFDDDIDNPADMVMTPTQDAAIVNGTSGQFNAIRALYKIYNTTPADITVTDAQAYSLQSAYFEAA